MFCLSRLRLNYFLTITHDIINIRMCVFVLYSSENITKEIVDEEAVYEGKRIGLEEDVKKVISTAPTYPHLGVVKHMYRPEYI